MLLFYVHPLCTYIYIFPPFFLQYNLSPRGQPPDYPNYRTATPDPKPDLPDTYPDYRDDYKLVTKPPTDAYRIEANLTSFGSMKLLPTFEEDEEVAAVEVTHSTKFSGSEESSGRRHEGEVTEEEGEEKANEEPELVHDLVNLDTYTDQDIDAIVEVMQEDTSEIVHNNNSNSYLSRIRVMMMYLMVSIMRSMMMKTMMICGSKRMDFSKVWKVYHSRGLLEAWVVSTVHQCKVLKISMVVLISRKVF